MAQIFHPSTNTISRLSIVGVVLGLGALSGALFAANNTYGRRLYVPIEQPVQFSHKHHVKDDGIDCRYCHTTVEDGSFAGLPPTHTCMTCHSKIWADSPLLAPVRESYVTGKPLEWIRVHDKPDFVYFNHSIHVKKGVPCQTCHGNVDEMPLTMQTESMTMDWCVQCHRNPAPYLRPREDVTNMDYTPPRDKRAMSEQLMEKYHVRSPDILTNCSICHR